MALILAKKRRVIEVWNFIDVNDTKELVRSMKHRFRDIITKKSERTKYQYNIICRNGK